MDAPAAALGLRVAWQAESLFMQSMAFSLVLVTLAFSFLHISRRAKSLSAPNQRGGGASSIAAPAGLVLAAMLGLLALGFGAVALYGFGARSWQLQRGASASGALLSPDGGIHAAYLFLGGSLLLVEFAFLLGILV